MLKLTKGTKEGALAYFGGAENEGYWRGRAARELGLSDTVSRGEFEAVLSAFHPQTGQFLLKKPNRERMACLDSLIAAPKSVSVMAIAMQDRIVLEAHRKAVDRAIEQAEAIAEAEHYSLGNRRYEKTENLAIACFEHWDSRIDVKETSFDPHLHTHLVIANFTQRKDEQWRALRNRPYFRQQSVIGLCYQYHLACLLHEQGYGLQIKPNGTIDIKIDRAIIEQFSKRNRHIEALRDELLQIGQKVELYQVQRKTRKPKTIREFPLIWQEWQEQLQAYPPITISPPSEQQTMFLECVSELITANELSMENWQQMSYETANKLELNENSELLGQRLNFEL
jgi:conjugative relaxase-like TrwC/TraI family protein